MVFGGRIDDGARLTDGQGQLFYEHCLEKLVPPDHLARKLAAVLDLGWVPGELSPYYSHVCFTPDSVAKVFDLTPQKPKLSNAAPPLTGNDPACLAPSVFRMGKVREDCPQSAEDLEWKVARNGSG